MPTLTVIAGPNGGGKSTLTAAVNFEGRANLIDPDEIAHRSSSSYSLRADAAAAREALIRCRDYLANKTSFAFETTLAGKGAIGRMRNAKSAGFRVSCYMLHLVVPNCISSAPGGAYRGVDTTFQMRIFVPMGA